MDNFESFATASGSFSRNHDNSIKIFKVSFTMGKLFFKNTESFNNAHGKHKGVMDIRSTNLSEDYYLVSSGNEDDCRILIWDIEIKQVIREITSDEKLPIYNLNVIAMTMDDNEEDDSNSQKISDQIQNSNSDEESNIESIIGLVIVAASIRSIRFINHNISENDFELDEEFDVNSDIGSYYNIMKTINHDNKNLSVLIGNVKGEFDIFSMELNLSYQENMLGDLRVIDNITPIVKIQRNESPYKKGFSKEQDFFV